MNRKRVIVDTGPLVAFINKSDAHHQWAKTQFSLITPPFISCESVISETCFLLRKSANGPTRIVQLIERELIVFPFDPQAEASSIRKLMEKYRTVPMSFADACLVRLSEQISESVICTIDRDFAIYRKHRRDVIPLIIPED
ncbi:MAG: PIN domain-containing protein [Desulfofustis sp. PB-SRB1]|nr:PIN domain-containing protein [Desulfofustis sp. PB-SRB1]MBM1000891.1 PIN domain-containing protein [Desulfofustis sp. PB-SRB1]HBH29545.1 type II toxin-antitoxin system VapC family toxin [Desulfofustis sp.]HBH32604.1 type II toxin-antitoxin system VapC family toxin [Desulfofustis sp.]